MTPHREPSRTIEILVSPSGSVQIKAVGFTGSSCRDATRNLERALGVAGTVTLLPEYFVTQRSNAACGGSPRSDHKPGREI